MSGTKVTGIVVTGGSTAASLPVTGSPVFAIVVAGVALVVTGFLMVSGVPLQPQRSLTPMTAILSGRLRAADARGRHTTWRWWPSPPVTRPTSAGAAGATPSRRTGTSRRPSGIVVPALNEERVVGRTVGAALALSGPGRHTHQGPGGR